MHIDILLETSDFLVINKPAGLRTHGDGKSEVPTVVDWILERYPELAGVGEPMEVDGPAFAKASAGHSKMKMIDRPGIVHRLDQETSGVLIIAKTQASFSYLKQQFKDRNVHKQYHAFVWGHFKEPLGVVDEPIGRSPSDFRRRLAGRGVRGEMREAVTKWEAIEQFQDESGQQFSFMYLFPKSGRTHQLRVHMKYLQRPIVSDSLYGGKPALGFERVALHARTIMFRGLQGDKIDVTAPYPIDFERAVGQYCTDIAARSIL